MPKGFSVDGDGDDDVDSEVAGDVDGEDDQAAGHDVRAGSASLGLPPPPPLLLSSLLLLLFQPLQSQPNPSN